MVAPSVSVPHNRLAEESAAVGVACSIDTEPINDTRLCSHVEFKSLNAFSASKLHWSKHSSAEGHVVSLLHYSFCDFSI
jgi:hypothetical protein